jgi:hypothetical protein
MKSALIALFLLTALSIVTAAQTTVNIQNDFGFTLVDVGKAVDVPDYSSSTRQGLDDWDQFHYKGIVQVLFQRSETVSWGPELGISRLYYWEEKYIPVGFSPRWRWGTIWTWHIGGIIRKQLSSGYYVLAGGSLHTFMDGSGTTLGIPLAFGREFTFSDKITLPVEFRTDIVFGNDTPIGIGGGIGVKFPVGQ